MRRKYQPGDIAQFYFVVFNDNGDKRIVGWTDDKQLAKFYLEFHNCKNLELKEKRAKVEVIYGIIDENVHDQIDIYNIIVRDPDKPDRVITINIPATETEKNFVDSETNTFMESRVAYGLLNEVIPFLKPKYQRALKQLLLPDVIMSVCHNKRTQIIDQIELDQLMILYRSFPSMFGK